MLLCQLRSRAAPHPRPAIEHHLLVLGRFREAEAVFELLFRQEDGVRLGFDGDVDRGRDVAGLVFGRFADV